MPKSKKQHGAILEHGMRDPEHPDVKKLQGLLLDHGFDVDGERGFGLKTRTQVIAFQLVNRIKANGVVGLHTWNALYEKPTKAKKDKVQSKVRPPSSKVPKKVES